MPCIQRLTQATEAAAAARHAAGTSSTQNESDENMPSLAQQLEDRDMMSIVLLVTHCRCKCSCTDNSAYATTHKARLAKNKWMSLMLERVTQSKGRFCVTDVQNTKTCIGVQENAVLQTGGGFCGTRYVVSSIEMYMTETVFSD